MPTPLWDALIQAGKRASIENAFADAFAPVSDDDGDGSHFTT
jgi:hypothetical protein